MAPYSFGRGRLSRHGEPVAMVASAADDPASIQRAEHTMRRAVRLLNEAEPRERPAYFSPDATPGERYMHAGLGALIVILLVGGLLTMAQSGFAAFLGFAALASLLYWLQPPR